jgi:hypothetical protein
MGEAQNSDTSSDPFCEAKVNSLKFTLETCMGFYPLLTRSKVDENNRSFAVMARREHGRATYIDNSFS